MPRTRTPHVVTPCFGVTHFCFSCAFLRPQVGDGVQFVVYDANKRITGSDTWCLKSTSGLPQLVSFPEQASLLPKPIIPSGDFSNRDSSRRPITTIIRFYRFARSFKVNTIRRYPFTKPREPPSTKFLSSINSSRRATYVLRSWLKRRTFCCVVFVGPCNTIPLYHMFMLAACGVYRIS
jgi:hypothetical protein